jgi:hypothetical protein
VAVMMIGGVAAGFRHTLPGWRREEFVLIALPLFGFLRKTVQIF